ncbi:WD repeat-containing protein 62 [Echinococcus granulosus]|uniref:Mitogen activated protein kinase binding protein n=1 Tax=Echinococcus granulosus TaxID=6210 RepID=A0A068W9I1_ECHGR|nr:WD repeat-containing protein 62 [Echinococcus granulosus]CDS16278.1 mitogen activated protein kinase binding protein [Echinococcus granulosus]
MSKTPRPYRTVKTKSNFSVVLERVLGFTAVNNCSVAIDTKNSTVFYVAGCVVVGESCETNNQFIVQSPARKSLTCLDVSQDGKYIITGESGHQPMVRVWSRVDGRQIGTLSSHHFRISSVRFSPATATHIVSVGCQEDQTICLWDRAQLQKVASAKVSARVNAVAFSDSGEFFVTVGIRHVRFWYIDLKRRPKVKETQPLKGRNAVLGDMLHNTFTDVCCCVGPAEANGESRALILVLSQAGQLLQINAARCVAKWVDLKVTSTACMTLSGQTVAVGCASGVCLIFSAITLRFIARVPLPHPLGSNVFKSKVGVLSSVTSSGNRREETRYAEVAAIRLDLAAGHLICMYADHSLYCWNVADLRSIGRQFAHFYHSRAVCGGAVTTSGTCPMLDETNLGRWAPADAAGTTTFHMEHFVTCSDDDTVRVWSFPVNRSTLKSHELFPDGKEEVSILYTDASYANLCSNERNSSGFGPTYFGQGSTLNLSAPGSPALVRQGPGRWSSNANIVATQNGPGFGLRSIAISPDARHFAVGDRSGQLRIYDFNTFKMLHSIRAHDAEILSITFFESKLMPDVSLLCTSSRDRVIHVFAPRQDYSRVQTLADHSGVVNSALFFESEETRRIYLISCGADRSLLFRILSTDPDSQTARFVIEHHISMTHSCACATVVGPSVLVPAETGLQGAVLPRARHYLAVACQDRQLRLYQIAKARQLFHYRASTCEDGSPVCCAADPTSTLIAAAGSDKHINLFHLFTGELVATLYGHADIVMGLIFLPDLRHLVSFSYDSCIFVWRLAPELTALMLERQQRVAAVLTASAPSTTDLPALGASPCNGSLPLSPNNVGSSSGEENVKFCFNENDLPSWARDRQRPESDTGTLEYFSLPSRMVKRSFTGFLNPSSPTEITVVAHVSRSQSERVRPSLVSKRQRNRTTSAVPAELSRGNSLGGLPTSSGTCRDDGVGCPADEDISTPSMFSSAVFPRWASSVTNITQEIPFKPPLAPSSDAANGDLIDIHSLPLTSSLSTEVLSAFEDLPSQCQSNNGLMGRSQIEDYCSKLGRVKEREIPARECSTEEAVQVQPNSLPHQKPSTRASWLEPDIGTVVSAFACDTEGGQDASFIRAPEGEVLSCAHGTTYCLSKKNVDDFSNSVSSASGSALALSLLSNVRQALDAAAEHLAAFSADSSTICEGRKFFHSYLEWRVARLRGILQVGSLVSSSQLSPSTQSPTTDTPAQRVEKTAPSQAAVVKLIEHFTPSIRSAMAETLTAGVGAGMGTSSEETDGALKIPVDPFPDD